MRLHIDDGIRIEATYQGIDMNGNHLLSDVKGDIQRDHAYLNGERSNFPGPEYPEGIMAGQRVKMFCCLFPRPGGARLTDAREVRII
jgi:hypothetical protein